MRTDLRARPCARRIARAGRVLDDVGGKEYCMETCVQERSGLSAAEIFHGASPEALAMLEAGSMLQSFAAGDTIFAAESTSDPCVYVVIEGRAGIYRTNGADERLELAEIGPGGSFGEFSVIGGGHRSANAEALAPTALWQIPSSAFLTFLHDHPEVAINLLRKLVGLVRNLDDRLARKSSADHATTIVFEKLLRFTL